MSSRLKIILIIIIMSINIIDINYSYSNDREVKNILVVGTYNEDYTYNKYILQGFLDEIDKLDEYININIFVEKMDASKEFSDEFYEKYRKYMKNKYKNETIDLIVMVENETFTHAIESIDNGESFLYKKKILLVGTNIDIDLKEEDKEYITLIEDVSDFKNLSLIEKLHENIDTINILLNDNTTIQEYIENVETSSLFLDREIDINYIIGDTVTEIKDKLKNIPSKNQAYIINGVFFSDEHKNFQLDTITNVIKDISDGPIYSTDSSYLQKGVIGGYVRNAEKLGIYSAREAINMIDDNIIIEDIIKVRLESPPILDYKELKKYDVDLGKIPTGTEIINKPKYAVLISDEDKIFLYKEFILFLIFISIVVISNFLIKRKIGNLKKIKELNKIAIEREKMQTDFIVNVSHEFRTPLNVIQSTIKVIEMKVLMKDMNDDYLMDRLEQVNKNSNRLLKLVNDLIDMNRFDVGNYDMMLENLNIVQVIEDITMATVDYASSKNIDLIFDTEEEEIILAIDKEKIERLLLNLLSNAIKYTNENGHIEVCIRLDENNVVISVTDNGIGISKDKQNKIFTRFYQADEILKRIEEGSGIGLCIVEEIVIMHKGDIKVESEENKGSKFEVTLPIYKVNVSSENKIISDINQSVKIAMSDILDTK